jgi:hypothetical protein
MKLFNLYYNWKQIVSFLQLFGNSTSGIGIGKKSQFLSNLLFYYQSFERLEKSISLKVARVSDKR